MYPVQAEEHQSSSVGRSIGRARIQQTHNSSHFITYARRALALMTTSSMYPRVEWSATSMNTNFRDTDLRCTTCPLISIKTVGFSDSIIGGPCKTHVKSRNNSIYAVSVTVCLCINQSKLRLFFWYFLKQISTDVLPRIEHSSPDLNTHLRISSESVERHY